MEFLSLRCSVFFLVLCGICQYPEFSFSWPLQKEKMWVIFKIQTKAYKQSQIMITFHREYFK